ALNAATNEFAGAGKSISDTPITLNVSKSNAPNLTMVDLPGITWVPVHGQPQDIYDQISQVIKQYITPKESIIMNVLSASVDFPTCESIRMSQLVDEKGERTLAVVTKVDNAAEGLFEKVTVDVVNIGLGYTCVYSFAKRSRNLAVQACDYLDRIICRVIDPQLQASSRRAFQALIDRKRDKCIQYVEDAMEMQKSIVYTENPSYSKSLQKMQQWKESFIEVIRQNHKAVKIDVCLYLVWIAHRIQAQQ
ncbi:hypothetical protein KI387_023601, partial [Taxus chinensis]